MHLRRIVFVAGLLAVLLGCAHNEPLIKTVPILNVEGGQGGEFTFESGTNATSGDVVATLADGATFRGRWTQLGGGAELSSVFVMTPGGPVYGNALTGGATPWGIATLSGVEETMICAFTGTFESGFARCADSRGKQWVGNW